MKKKTKIIILILILLLFGGLLTFFIINNKNKELVTEDSLKFKEDYESVNGKKISDELTYSSLDIPKNNPIKYSSYEEIFKILDNGTGIIYLGFPECPWCRNIIPVLIDTALKSKVKTIYYLNIKDDRNVLSLTKKGKIKTEKEGTEDYLKLVDLLKDNLREYEGLKNKDIKRIYVPLVIFVKDGKVVGIYESLPAFQERANGNGFTQMNEKEKSELSKIYENYFKKLK